MSSPGTVAAEWFLRRVAVGPPLRAYLRLTVEGHEHLPATGPVIIASNHLSFLDSMVIPLAAGRKVGFLGKAEYVTGTGVSLSLIHISEPTRRS